MYFIYQLSCGIVGAIKGGWSQQLHCIWGNNDANLPSSNRRVITIVMAPTFSQHAQNFSFLATFRSDPDVHRPYNSYRQSSILQWSIYTAMEHLYCKVIFYRTKLQVTGNYFISYYLAPQGDKQCR